MSSAASVLRTAVLNRTGLASTDGMATSTVVYPLLNAAARRLAADREWDWLLAEETINLVAGQTEYTPAATWRATVRVAVGDTLLQRIQPRQMIRWRLEEGQRPIFWTVERSKLIVAPYPSAAGEDIKHMYVRTETPVTGDSDTFLTPDWAEDLIVVGAARLLATRLRDAALVRLLDEEYTELRRALEDEQARAKGPMAPGHRTDAVL